MTTARLLVLATVAALVAPAAAQESPDGGDDDFGPVVEIERVNVVGNTSTAERLIRRALQVKEGDRLRTGDPRLLGSRFRLLGLGYFRDVRLHLEKGSRPGALILTVAVEERGTAVLNRVFLGNSDITPIWLGLDGGDSNFLGTGIGVGAAFVWTAAQDLPGGDNQLALRLRLSDGSLFGTAFGARAVFLYDDASEPVGDEARPYRRVGGMAGVTYRVTRLSTLSLDARVEAVHAGDAPPPALEAGDSTLATLTLGFDRDTRRDPILPDGGYHLQLALEGGSAAIGSYDELRLLASWQGWHKVGHRHVVSLLLGAGLIAGDAPRFDRFYVGDLDPLLPPRALDLVVSARKSPDLLGDGMDELVYGRVAGGATVEYAYQLFRTPRTVYGGDLFASVGVFALGETDDLRFDLSFNVGLRLDTFIGVFELSLGNALGRIPF